MEWCLGSSLLQVRNLFSRLMITKTVIKYSYDVKTFEQMLTCSNIWSEMIAADLYTAFQEIKSDDKSQQREISARFRDTFLALGGSYPTAEIFRKFRGRDPSPQALLDNLGLTQETKKVK